MLHTLSFIVGFSIIFYALGLTAGFVGNFFIDYRDLLRQIAALLIFHHGIVPARHFPASMVNEGTQIVDSNFVLLAMLALSLLEWALQQGGPLVLDRFCPPFLHSHNGTWNMVSVNDGLFTWFCDSIFCISFFIGSTKWILRYSDLIMKIGGGLMIVIAVLLYTGKMTQITLWLNSITPDLLKF